MRVAIEAGTLVLSSGGLARYTAELSLALARTYPDDEFYLVCDRPFPLPPGAPPNLKRGGGPRNAAERRWWLWGLNRELSRLHADLIHGPDFAVPYLARRPSVLTVHDLSPWMDPRWHHAAHRVRRRTPALLELGLATMIVTPSEVVRKQAIGRFRLHPDRVVATPEAAAPWFRPVPVAPCADNRRYFLFVGTLEPRKNLPALLEAFREVRRTHEVDLVLVGRKRDDFPADCALSGVEGLRWLGEVADEELAPLYSGALAFVYPSLYEGFGLPVLEAMQCGACVIASPALRETGGSAAIYAEGTDGMVRTMREVCENAQLVARYKEHSLLRAREFTWERTARTTYEVYREARRRFGN